MRALIVVAGLTAPLFAASLAVAASASPAATPQAPARAQPQPATSLTLADAAQAPARPLIIDGARWSCEGAVCTASGGTEQPASRACRRVVQKFGPVTAFSYKGDALSADQLGVCNA